MIILTKVLWEVITAHNRQIIFHVHVLHGHPTGMALWVCWLCTFSPLTEITYSLTSSFSLSPTTVTISDSPASGSNTGGKQIFTVVNYYKILFVFWIGAN